LTSKRSSACSSLEAISRACSTLAASCREICAAQADLVHVLPENDLQAYGSWDDLDGQMTSIISGITH